MHFSFFVTITAGPIARAQNAKGLTDISGQSCGMSTQITTNQPCKILLPSLALILLVLALIKMVDRRMACGSMGKSCIR